MGFGGRLRFGRTDRLLCESHLLAPPRLELKVRVKVAHPIHSSNPMKIMSALRGRAVVLCLI